MRFRPLRAAAALLVAAGLAAAPALAPVAEAGLRAAAPRSPLTVRLSSMSPVAGLTPGHDLVVRGVLRNTSATPVGNLSVVLRLHGTVLTARQDIDDWMADDDPATSGIELPGRTTIRPVAAGGSRSFAVRVPADRLGLPAASYSFGPRGLVVEADRKSTTVGTLRTTVVWSPAPTSEPTTGLSLLAPITTAGPTRDAGAATASTARSLAAGGRLRSVLDAADDSAFDWAVDPAVLQAADRIATGGVTAEPGATPGASASTTGAPTPTSSEPAEDREQEQADAHSWLTRFGDGRGDRSVLGLPYADPDVNSVLNGGRPALLGSADRLGRKVTEDVLGGDLENGVAWPGDGRIAPDSIEALGRADYTDVLMAAGSQPPDPVPDYTPTGRSTMRAHGQTIHGLLYDEQLSALVTSSGGSDPVQATQTLLAQLAAIGLERPDDARTVLAVTPRDWSPDPQTVQTMLNALRGAPWVNLDGIDTLRQQDVAAVHRARPIYPAAAVAAQLPAGLLGSIATLNDALSLFGPAMVTPEPALTELREQVLSLVGLGWRGRDDLYDARLTVARELAPVISGVRLLGSSSKVFTARKASIPLFVQNDTPYPVKVQVELRALTAQVTFTGPVTVTVGAGVHSQVLVPARAVTDGNVDVDVEARMFTPDGRQLGATQSFQIKVRPKWEARIMTGAAVVLGLMLVLGVGRSIRRGGTRVPPEAVPDVDDLASRRADVLGNTSPSAGSRQDDGDTPGPGEPAPGRTEGTDGEPDGQGGAAGAAGETGAADAADHDRPGGVLRPEGGDAADAAGGHPAGAAGARGRGEHRGQHPVEHGVEHHRRGDA